MIQNHKHWTPKQHNETAQPKADKYPTSHFSLFNRFFFSLQKRDYDKNSHVMFSHNEQHSFKPFMCFNLENNLK